MIQTVTHRAAKEEIGKTLIHEHIRCASNDMLSAFGDKWLSESELLGRALEIITAMKERYGLDTIVDGTPIDLGRNAKILKKLSELSGVKIVASSGLYHYPSFVTLTNSEQTMAEWFLDEIKNGLDGTSVRPGILKCATDNLGISEENKKRIGALGRVQGESGLPLYLHTLHQEGTLKKALGILLDRGADPEKIIVGHLDDACDFEYTEKIIRLGCYVSFDRRQAAPDHTEKVAKTMVRLFDGGYGSRLLVSNDCCIYSDFCPPQNKWVSPDNIRDSMGYALDGLKAEFLKQGGSEAAFNQMITANARDSLDVR
jgi:phosphotriesterase-related protein